MNRLLKTADRIILHGCGIRYRTISRHDGGQAISSPVIMGELIPVAGVINGVTG